MRGTAPHLRRDCCGPLRIPSAFTIGRVRPAPARGVPARGGGQVVMLFVTAIVTPFEVSFVDKASARGTDRTR